MTRQTGLFVATAIVALLLGARETATAEPAAGPAPAAGGLGALTARALRVGSDAKLPPNLVSTLGFGTQETGMPVRQLAIRVGGDVRAFNVSKAHPAVVVMFDHNEVSRVTVAYLVSSAGKLRRAVSYQAGGAGGVLPAAEAQRRFAPELKYWLAVGQGAAPAP